VVAACLNAGVAAGVEKPAPDGFFKQPNYQDQPGKPKTAPAGQINRVQAPSAAASSSPIRHLMRILFLSHLPERVIKLGVRNESIAAIGRVDIAFLMYNEIRFCCKK
jgi:hypothetical protein